MSKSKINDLGFLELSPGTDPVVEYVPRAIHVAAQLFLPASSLSTDWMDIERRHGPQATDFCGCVTSCPPIYPTLESSPMDTTPTLEVENVYQRRRFGDMRMDSLKLFHGYVKTLRE